MRGALRFFSQASSLSVAAKQMVPLKELAGLVELCFATKEGLPVRRFPIEHSAVALRQTGASDASASASAYAIRGRQSPWDFSNWLSKGISFRTVQDDESKYLDPDYHFHVQPTGIKMTVAEAEALLAEADQRINSQFCNMITSNCYSFSVMTLVLALDKLAKAETLDAQSCSKLIQVLLDKPLSDHGGFFGVRNNKILAEQIAKTCKALEERIEQSKEPNHQLLLLMKQTTILNEKFNDAGVWDWAFHGMKFNL